MGKNWFWKVETNSLIFLALALVDCDCECKSYGELAPYQSKRKLITSVIDWYFWQEDSSPFVCPNSHLKLNLISLCKLNVYYIPHIQLSYPEAASQSSLYHF